MMTTWVDCQPLLYDLLSGRLNQHQVQQQVAYDGYQRRRLIAGSRGDQLSDWLDAAQVLNQAIYNYELAVQPFPA